MKLYPIKNDNGQNFPLFSLHLFDFASTDFLWRLFFFLQKI